MMSRDAEALLEKGRASPPRPSDASRARMRERVLVQVGAVALAGASAATAKASPAVASTFAKVGLAWKLLGAVVLSGGLVGGALVLRELDPSSAPAAPVAPQSVGAQRTDPEASPPPPPPPAAAPAETNERAVAAAPSAQPAQSAGGPPPTPAPKQSATSPADALAEEASLLKEAQAALGSGNGAKALSLANEHASRYPSGALSSERQLLRALALCATGDKPQGVSEGRASFPDESSAGRKRIEAACQ